ncbi:hypothetical protein DITRI_Ditri19aG0118900 [Diplodiscus trichospermus]
MVDELQTMWLKLAITEEKANEIFIANDWVDNVIQILKHNLLGKMLIPKPYKVENMKVVFHNTWRIQASLSIPDIGHHCFIFFIEDEFEKDRVLLKQPWMFNKSLLVLQEYDGLQAPEEVDLIGVHSRYVFLAFHFICETNV